MASYITTKAEFIEYCLRQLGKPVIQINVSQQQIEDAYEEAVQYYIDHADDGTESVYMGHKITEDDIKQSYIQLPLEIISVFEFQYMPSGQINGGQLFNAHYQLIHDENSAVFDMLFGRNQKSGGGPGTGFIDYVMFKNYISDLATYFSPPPHYEFNKMTKRVHLFVSPNKLNPGDIAFFGVTKGIDPEKHIALFQDTWFKRYTAALIKLRWGSNLQKFDGVALPGGVTLNGEQLYQQALEEKRTLEEELADRWFGAAPIMVG